MHLTKAEEQIMQILWELKEATVSDIRSKFSDPRPARNTISTVVRILEKKGYAGHRTFGNVHVFSPVISRSEYSKHQLFGLMEKYFNNSFPAMASFFAKEKDLSIQDLEKLMEETKSELSKNKKKK